MQIIVEPNKVVSWNDFKFQSNSIALDGFVKGSPQAEAQTHTFNFNHHEDVDRLATRCTAAQVYIYLKQGLQKHLSKATKLFVNDCDQDVCLSTWLLCNHTRVTSGSEPLLNRLIFVTDMLDTCAGNYPLQLNSSVFEQSLWIYQPYNQARLRGIHLLNAQEMRSVIESVHCRIDKYLMGGSERVEADSRYTLLAPGKIPVIQEQGLEARTRLANEGIDCYASYKGVTSQGKHVYSIIKLSPLSSVDLSQVYSHLNSVDGATAEDCWGGSNTCGGSPRNSGSTLNPEKLALVLTQLLS